MRKRLSTRGRKLRKPVMRIRNSPKVELISSGFAPSNHRHGLLRPSRVPLVAVEVLQNDSESTLNHGPRSRSCMKLKNLKVQGYRNADACMKYAACHHSGC